MKKALETNAELEFSSVSGILKKAAVKKLFEHDIDWKKIPDKKNKK